MPLTDQHIDLTDDRVDTAKISLEYELEALQRAVERARRTGWADDAIEPEFENFLAALANPAPVRPTTPLASSPAGNPWQEHHG